MAFFKRRKSNPAMTNTTAATTKLVNTPTTTSRHVLINGSKPLSKLVEDHLERLWSASSMNLFIDHQKGRGSYFIHGDLHLAFKFFTSSGCTDNKFIVACCLCKNPAKKANQGKRVADDIIVDKDTFMEKQSEVRATDPTMRLKKINGSIVLFQKVSAATVLIDEELEETLDKFLGTADSVRSAVVLYRKRRRRLAVLSWFQKKTEC